MNAVIVFSGVNSVHCSNLYGGYWWQQVIGIIQCQYMNVPFLFRDMKDVLSSSLCGPLMAAGNNTMNCQEISTLIISGVSDMLSSSLSGPPMAPGNSDYMSRIQNFCHSGMNDKLWSR